MSAASQPFLGTVPVKGGRKAGAAGPMHYGSRNNLAERGDMAGGLHVTLTVMEQVDFLFYWELCGFTANAVPLAVLF